MGVGVVGVVSRAEASTKAVVQGAPGAYRTFGEPLAGTVTTPDQRVP